jgi:hypothetical protein
MGIRLGRPAELLLDADALRAVALEVACGDDVVRLLPIAAARLQADQIALDSPFVLIEHGERSFYKRRTRRLCALRGAGVSRAGRRLGRLEDVEMAADGTVTALVLEGGERLRPVDGLDVHDGDTASAA